jgi:acetyl esterase/lipase
MTALLRGIAIAALVLLAHAAAGGQDKSTYYTVRHPAEFKINWAAFYDKAEQLTAAVRKDLPHMLDLAYGSDPKQRLDVYQPAGKPTGAPVFIFLHGGGFREGDRAQYGFVARPLAARGVVTIVASYRLTPQAYFPDQPNDVRQIVAWTYREAAKYGGDPARIYVGGHSAGAILSSFVGLDNRWTSGFSLPPDVIKGILPISGPYDLRNHPSAAEYVHDPVRAAEASPLLNVNNPPARTVVAVGSVEPYVDATKALAEAVRARGGAAEVVILEGEDHAQTALSLGNPSSPLVVALLKMMGQ